MRKKSRTNSTCPWIDRHEVEARTGLSQSSIYKIEDFPKPVKIATRKVVWLVCEIEAWVNGRIAERDRKLARVGRNAA